MLDFQRYQAEFTAHIRDPNAHKKPARVVEERMAVYRQGVFNNVFESVSVCFPVCQAALGKRAWRNLVRAFFKSYGAKSPIFREIPRQFLDFLTVAPSLQTPVFLNQLAHYEWVELAVSALETETKTLSKTADLLHEKPALTPAHMLLKYDFPVHKISARFKPTTPESAYLFVYRCADFQVKFIELNLMTYQLLQLISQNNMTGAQALKQLAADIKHPDTDAVIKFGAEILQDLAKQEAIIGSTKLN
jgi:uncharacterized protein